MGASYSNAVTVTGWSDAKAAARVLERAELVEGAGAGVAVLGPHALGADGEHGPAAVDELGERVGLPRLQVLADDGRRGVAARFVAVGPADEEVHLGHRR